MMWNGAGVLFSRFLSFFYSCNCLKNVAYWAARLHCMAVRTRIAWPGTAAWLFVWHGSGFL